MCFRQYDYQPVIREMSADHSTKRKDAPVGLILTALRGTRKDFMLSQLKGTAPVPWNWHVLCKSVADYQQFQSLTRKVRRYAYADQIKVEDFDGVNASNAVRDLVEWPQFIAACDVVRHAEHTPEWLSGFTREEKIAVYDILKHKPFWRQCLIDRGMEGRAQDPNRWVNPTLDEIEADFMIDRGDYDEGNAGHESSHFFAACREVVGGSVSLMTFNQDQKFQIMRQVKHMHYWKESILDYMIPKTPVITDSRWPSEIDRVLERFPEFKSVRLWAPDIPMVDDPSENSMTDVLTDYVLIRAPLTLTDEPTTPGYLLDQFKKAYPQYEGYGVYICS